MTPLKKIPGAPNARRALRDRSAAAIVYVSRHPSSDVRFHVSQSPVSASSPSVSSIGDRTWPVGHRAWRTGHRASTAGDDDSSFASFDFSARRSTTAFSPSCNANRRSRTVDRFSRMINWIHCIGIRSSRFTSPRSHTLDLLSRTRCSSIETGRSSIETDRPAPTKSLPALSISDLGVVRLTPSGASC